MQNKINKKIVGIIIVFICVLIGMKYIGSDSENLEEMTTLNRVDDVLTEGSSKATSETATEESTTENIPYVGMPTSEISSTALGEAHYYGANHLKTDKGYQKSDIYDYYDENEYTIFVINVVDGRVYRVHDRRDNPWHRKKPDKKPENNNRETTSVKKDWYGAENYGVDDYEDFYDDNYGDFEDIDEAADYLEEYWAEYE